MTVTVETLTNEMTQLEAALQEPQDPDTELRIRQRYAFVAQRRAEIDQAAPFAEIETADLEAKLQEVQERREDLLSELTVAKSDNLRPARAKRLEREFAALQDEQAALRFEFNERTFAEATTVLGEYRAQVVAAREILEQDRAAVADLDDWRQAKAIEQLTASREARVAKHVPNVHARLIENAELSAGARLMNLGPAVEAVVEATPREQEFDDE